MNIELGAASSDRNFCSVSVHCMNSWGGWILDFHPSVANVTLNMLDDSKCIFVVPKLSAHA